MHCGWDVSGEQYLVAGQDQRHYLSDERAVSFQYSSYHRQVTEYAIHGVSAGSNFQELE
jgi:hypothetical protein